MISSHGTIYIISLYQFLTTVSLYHYLYIIPGLRYVTLPDLRLFAS